MDWKKGVDVSPCFLVEGTADSETDAGPAKIHIDVAVAVAGDGPQDAESCILDASDILGLTEPEILESDDHDQESKCSSQGRGNGSTVRDNQQEPSTSGFCERLLSEDVSLGCLSGEEGEEEKKIGETKVDDMEDRDFWEACIEVGYP